jgi:transcriptional regulator with XRE-family HTH domain
MYENEFQTRLAQLREKKGVSARDMSLSIGQNPGYINNIETGKALPSMSGFFYICEYLQLSPKDFFDTDAKNPEKLNELIKDLKRLDDKQLDSIASIVQGLVKKG